MKGALIRYNLLIQTNREKGRIKELLPVWDSYCEEMQSFDWNNWDIKKLWHFCPYTQFPTKRFVESWIEIIKAEKFNETKASELLKDRELKLKGIQN